LVFRLSLARIRAAIAHFFGARGATRASLPSAVVAPMAVAPVPDEVPDLALGPRPELRPEASPALTPDVTEALAMPERHDSPCPETQPAEAETRAETEVVAEAPAEAEGPAAVVAAPDPDAERLLARCTLLQGQMLDLTTRLADMEHQVRSYEQHQYQALGEVVSECLRLRQEYLSLKAARSGAAADRERARQADEDFDAYRRSTEQAAAPLPELDDDEQDELRRLYRAAAMRCHPDRAAEAERAEAHEIFLRVQAAYQACDLAGLRSITAELAGLARRDQAAGTAGTGTAEPAAAPASSAVRRRVAELQIQVADLILAVQTLQLDPAYRQALQVERREAQFADARARFEAECETLREQIAILASRAA
jgi:hypothetical protein